MKYIDERISKLPDRYSNVEYLAAGGMGLVYKACDKVLNRKVVIKLLQYSKTQKSGILRKRLAREAKSLCALRHKNVVRVYDFHSSNDITYIVLEYLEGTVLTELITSEPLNCDEILKLIAELAEGLEAIHVAGILHRDIKPENIIVTLDGKPTFIDFGLTTFSAEPGINKTQTCLTETNCIVGTVGYLAPELLFGSEHNRKCDIFQIGVIFYELLTGKKLIDHQAFNSMLKGEMPEYILPSTINEKVDSSIDDIVLSAIEPDPDKRTASARKLAEQCRACLRQRSSEEIPLSKTVAISIVPGDDKLEKKSIKSWIGFLVCITFILSAFYLFRIREESPMFSVTTTVDSISVTVKGRHSWYLTERESNKVIFKGNTEVASSFECKRLEPETNYTLHFDGKWKEACRTKSPKLTKNVKAYAFDKSILLQLFTDLNRGLFRLIVNDKLEKEISVEAGYGQIIIKDPELRKASTVSWKLFYKNTALASGENNNSVDFHLDRAFGRRAHPLPCWMGEDLLIADKNRQFRLLRPGAKLKEILNFYSEGIALRDRRSLTSFDDKRAFYIATPYGAEVLFNIISPMTREVREGKVNLPAAANIVQAPSLTSRALVFNGLSQMKPSWFLVDINKEALLSYQQAKKVLAVRDDGNDRETFSINFGKSNISEQGCGFIGSPKLKDGRIWSVFGKLQPENKNVLDCKLYSLPLTEKETKLGRPVLHGSFTTWLGKHQFGYLGREKSLGCSAMKRIYKIDPHSASLVEVINISGKINIPQEAYIGSPAFSVQNRNYAIIFCDVLSKPRRLGTIISQKEAFLLYWKNGQKFPVMEKRLFIDPVGTYQAPAVFWMSVWQDRYLVGATSLTLFAIDLKTKKVGSVHYAGDIIVSVVLSNQGTVALVLQGERFSMIPVELIPFQ